LGLAAVIVLDTHIWLWWIAGNDCQLKSAWRQKIADADQVGVSPISCFEVAWLVQHGRIELSEPLVPWFVKALSGSGIRLLAITPKIARRAVDLPEHHCDPQDRIIIVTALMQDALLLSADGKFPLYQELADRLLS
jgi:PIN domain nuclease of toxin-antitoxin system